MAMTREDKETVEAILNRTNLSSLLSAVGDICRDKAKHVMSSRQDRTLAIQWGIAADKIDRLSEHRDIEVIP